MRPLRSLLVPVKRLIPIALLGWGLVLLPATSTLAQEETANPIVDIAGEMTGVVRELNKLATGKPTQETQKDIVRKLDELIEQLEKD